MDKLEENGAAVFDEAEEQPWDDEQGWGEGDNDGWDGADEDDFTLPSERGF